MQHLDKLVQKIVQIFSFDFINFSKYPNFFIITKPKIPNTICKDSIVEVKTNSDDLSLIAFKLCSSPKFNLINVIPRSVKIGIIIHKDGAVSTVTPCSNIFLKPKIIFININIIASEEKVLLQIFQLHLQQYLNS